MFSNRTHFDCLIVGGGPAGSVLAATLADWGRRVCILDFGSSPHPFPHQSLSADADPLLKRNGIMTSIREHGSIRDCKRFLIWGDGEPRELQLESGKAGYRIDRDLLDPDLRNLARSLGVTVVQNAEVIAPLPESGAGEVCFETRGRQYSATADVIVVASGRRHQSGILPLSLDHSAPEMFALTATIRCERKSRDIDVVEAIPEGWFWWFSEENLHPQLALFTDIPAGEWRHATRLASNLLSRSLKGRFALERSRLRYLNVTPRLVSSPSDILVIGDAACTLDPLLGRGVETSIAAAESAAVCVNTMLESADLRSECVQYLRGLERQRYFAHLSEALGLYLREARFSDQSFWKVRHALCEVEIEPVERGPLPMKLKVAQEVGRYPTLQRKGRLLERVIGMGRPGGPVHQSTLGIPVSALLDLVSQNHWTDDVLAMAKHHKTLYVHSRTTMTHALVELCRLGILEAADDPAA